MLALRHSHPKLLLGGGAWLKGYIIPPCTLKGAMPHFPLPPTYAVCGTQRPQPRLLLCSARCSEGGLPYSLQPFFLKVIADLRDKMDESIQVESQSYRDPPVLLFHYSAPTWNGCSSQCNWAEAVLLYTGSTVVSFAASSLLSYWAVLKINRLWPYVCQWLCWRPHQSTVCPPVSQ